MLSKKDAAEIKLFKTKGIRYNTFKDEYLSSLKMSDIDCKRIATALALQKAALFIFDIEPVTKLNALKASVIDTYKDIFNWLPRYTNGQIQPINLLPIVNGKMCDGFALMPGQHSKDYFWFWLSPTVGFKITQDLKVYAYRLDHRKWHCDYLGVIGTTCVDNNLEAVVSVKMLTVFEYIGLQAGSRDRVSLSTVRTSYKHGLLNLDQNQTISLIDLTKPIQSHPTGTGTGHVKGPHDRRQHVRTYRNPDGSIKKQVIIKTIKVKGGSDTANCVQIYQQK